MRKIQLPAASQALSPPARPAPGPEDEIKVATFVGPQHFMSQWLVKWSEKLEKDSRPPRLQALPGLADGADAAEVRPRAHRPGRGGLVPARRDAGRFLLTEVIQLPYMVGSAEIGTKVLNDPELRASTSMPSTRASRCCCCSRTSRARAHGQEGDPHRRRPEGHCAPLLLAADPRLRRRARRHPGRRTPTEQPSSCRRGPSTARSSTTAAPGSRSSWAAPSSTRPRCTRTSRATAW